MLKPKIKTYPQFKWIGHPYHYILLIIVQVYLIKAGSLLKINKIFTKEVYKTWQVVEAIANLKTIKHVSLITVQTAVAMDIYALL